MRKARTLNYGSKITDATDLRTTVGDLKTTVESFVVERNWAQFHSPKNLAMAIGVEAGELMDLFRWRSEVDSITGMQKKQFRLSATQELADVVICALAFANRTRIDLAKAVVDKVRKNARKYPVEKYRGRF